eukprot:456121_1
MASLSEHGSNIESDEMKVTKTNKSPQGSKPPPSYARVASMQNDSDDEKEEKNKDEFAIESPLMDNNEQTQNKSSPRDILNKIYDEVLSDEEENDEEEKQIPIQNIETKTKTKKIPNQTNEIEMIEMVTITNEEKHEYNNDNEHKNDDIMDKIHQHKSMLGATMNHSERLNSVWDFIEWRIIIQVFIAILLATLTFYVEFGIWRIFKISQCKKDIIYLSWNSFKYSIYEMWQNGFCFLFGNIYFNDCDFFLGDISSTIKKSNSSHDLDVFNFLMIVIIITAQMG